VNDDELVLAVAPVRMAVVPRRLTVSCPSSVSHRGLSDEGPGHVHLGLGDEFTKLSDLADLLEQPGERERKEGGRRRCE